MPPQIAFLMCGIFIVWLMRVDRSWKTNVSYALWIPLIWVLIMSSRPISYWFGVTPVMTTPDELLEGSPVDRLISTALIVSGALVLMRRKIDWRWIGRRNLSIFVFLAYCGISVIWSDFAFVSFKRWIKGIGNLVMVLVILTDGNCIEAVRALLRRWAYVLAPLSVVFIKYFPELGRGYDSWTGRAFYRGAACDKNALGSLALIFALFFAWDTLTQWRRRDGSLHKKQLAINAFFLVIIMWLMGKAQSATSLVAMVSGILLLFALGLPFLQTSESRTDFYLFLCLVGAVIGFTFLDVHGILLKSLGRDATLTGRTDLWHVLINMGTDPFVGVGYESFWLGGRAEALWEGYWWRPNEAHNGFLEIYLNLGGIGLLLLLAMLFGAYRRCRTALVAESDSGRLRMAFLGVTLLCSATEVPFRGLHPLWFLFLLCGMEWPQVQASDGAQ